MLDVLAHILIFGSVQHLCASSIVVLCLPVPLPFSLPCFFLGSVHGLPLWRAFHVEDCLYVCLAISIRAESTSLRYQMVFAILLEIIIPHL